MWSFLSTTFSCSVDDAADMVGISASFINPATGLPMLGDSTCGVDVGGNPYGTDLHSSGMAGLGGDFGSNPWD